MTNNTIPVQKSTRNRKKKRDRIKRSMNRYLFYNIFQINPQTGDIYPLYNIIVNGQFFQQYYSIPRGQSFGGVDIYQLVGREFGGTWNATTNTITLTTLY